MSKKPFKSQASSARAASTAFGSSSFGFGAPTIGFQTAASPLSYVSEQPDLTGISDPQIVVAFKNLGKKDSTTKAKALEELQDHLAGTSVGQNVIEPAVLEAWVSLYPRTSIDNSRRVRQLAHTLQGWITVSSGKRSAPYLPKVIGPWLAGTFDSDKGVARAAQDAARTAFTTQERREALWKIYRQPLLDYVEDAMLVQSQQTLSDERTTSPDDAEAKHVRVVSTAAFILLQLIRNEAPATIAMINSNSPYAKLLGDGKIWEFASHKDPSMRRAIYALIIPAVAVLEGYIDFKAVSTCFLAKAMHTTQLGSSGQYLDALILLTKHRPQIWTTDYTSKTPVSRRFIQFLKKGSQRGPESFWTHLSQLIRVVPTVVWSSNKPTDSLTTSPQPALTDAETFLDALHEGVTNTEEPRQNILAAWSTYSATALWLLRKVTAADSQPILEGYIYPIVEQHIFASSSNTHWGISAPHSTQICSRILVSLAEHQSDFQPLWANLSKHLIESLKLSRPETSKDFKASQNAVIAEADRFFQLQDLVSKSIPTESASKEIFTSTCSTIISECTKILGDRNGKPYSAAGTINAALSILPADFRSPDLDKFVEFNVSGMLKTPSSERLISTLLLYKHAPCYEQCFNRCVTVLATDHDLPNRDAIVARLLGNSRPEDLSHHPELSMIVTEYLNLALAGNVSKWRLILAVFENGELFPRNSVTRTSNDEHPSDLPDDVLAKMMGDLSTEDTQDAALIGFESILSDGQAASNIITTASASQILPQLLVVSDSTNEDIAKRASDLSAKLRSILKRRGSYSASSSIESVLHDQFEGIGKPMSVFGMVELAEQGLKESTDTERAKVLAALLPTTEHWETALAPFLDQIPPQASAITSPLQGTIYAVTSKDSKVPENIYRDNDDFSVAMRLAIYVTMLLSSNGNPDGPVSANINGLFLYYPQILQLINAKITTDSSSSIWLNSTPDVIDEATDILSKGQGMIQKWIQNDCDVSKNIIEIWQGQLLPMKGTSPKAYNLGLCFHSIMTSYADTIGSTRALEIWKAELISANRSTDLVLSAAILSVLGEVLSSSADGKKLFNDLVADATSLKSPSDSTNDLRPFVLLNILLREETGLLSSIPTQRMVFLFQNLVRISTSQEALPTVQTEVFKILGYVIFEVSDIYGDYWDQILDTLVALWETKGAQANLPHLHASIWLYSRLRALMSEEPNEDLAEAWAAKKSQLDASMVQLLASWQDVGSDTDQPQQITADLLGRQIRNVEISSLGNIGALYPLLESKQHSLQTATYELIHRIVPAQQEQKSLDIALENLKMHVPAELLSLITRLASEVDKIQMQRSLDIELPRTYLLSWALLFDNFTNASFKLKEMYHADIKTSNQIPTLLTLICALIRITSGKPVDASKFEVKNINLEAHDMAENEAQSIAIHLYYKALLLVPDLVKEWFIEQKNRIKSPLELWTQKYISPSIIAASLQAATEWEATQDQDDRPVSIKASPKASELVASITVDEESPPISLAVSMPGAYPLEQAVVTGRSRVGVSDKNWSAWLRTIQIIIFSTGNLIEGLIAFRRNVQGALRGQTECAICYSIIGTDMKTPDKRCGTCRNTFHSACLFRWFRSSNSSSCPLCRNNFNYA